MKALLLCVALSLCGCASRGEALSMQPQPQTQPGAVTAETLEIWRQGLITATRVIGRGDKTNGLRLVNLTIRSIGQKIASLTTGATLPAAVLPAAAAPSEDRAVEKVLQDALKAIAEEK